jgi:hypothetical protein
MYRDPIFFRPLALAGGEGSASRSGRFTPGGKTVGTHWTECSVGPRGGLGDVEKRKFLTLLGLKLRPLGPQPVASCHTDWKYRKIEGNISVAIATGWTAGVRYPAETIIASRPAVRPIQPPVRWVREKISSRGVKLTTYLQLEPRSRMVELYFHN